MVLQLISVAEETNKFSRNREDNYIYRIDLGYIFKFVSISFCFLTKRIKSDRRENLDQSIEDVLITVNEALS